MSIAHVLLGTMVAFGAASPALAAHSEADRTDALVTVAKPFTPTVQDDRQAAVTYLDDALTLLQMATVHLERGEHVQARTELMGASGKLTTAHLILFKDKGFSRDLAPISIRAEQAYEMAAKDADRARKMAASIRDDLRPVYRAQVARLGGGAGRGMEDLDNIRR